MTTPIDTLTLTRPDDWHIHLRDGPVLARTVADAARQFARVMAMPNLQPPITTTAQAQAYRQRIIAACPEGADFEPLMTLYLTDVTPVEEIALAHASGQVHGIKLYPAGATTHSQAGVTDLAHVYPLLEAMEKHGLPLQVHGEVTDPDVDTFDREHVYIERHLAPLVKHFPGLRIVFEHITTRAAVEFVQAAGPQVAATLTAHHLLLNRTAMFTGGLRPHLYCLPVLKREQDRQALLAAAVSGNPKFFLGSDSAPHARSAKEAACGCAGIYTAHAALELYAEAFDAAGALDRLEAFASHYGADFYRLPRNTSQIILKRTAHSVPPQLHFGPQMLIPFRASETIAWTRQDDNHP